MCKLLISPFPVSPTSFVSHPIPTPPQRVSSYHHPCHATFSPSHFLKEISANTRLLLCLFVLFFCLFVCVCVSEREKEKETQTQTQREFSFILSLVSLFYFIRNPEGTNRNRGSTDKLKQMQIKIRIIQQNDMILRKMRFFR